MAKKKKKKYHAMPKLCFVDHCIYWLILPVALIPSGLCVYMAFFLRNRVAFADAAVAAARAHGSMAWFLPGFCWTFGMALGLWYTKYTSRYPIFGSRGVKYGPPAYPKIYPLFMKNKPRVWVSEKAKESKRKLELILAAVTVVFLLLTSLSISGRDVLYEDGRLAEYNMFGVCTEEVDKPFVEKVEFGTCKESAGKSGPVYYSVDVTLWAADGEKYYFEASDFRWVKDTEIRCWIATMLNIKENYPGKVTCEEDRNVDKVLARGLWTDEERALIRELFDME